MNQAKQAVNPYLPSYEYVPDGEPHVFNGRVYVYGSHDRFGGNDFCLNDYVCWSARADDLANWRYEGTSYRSVQDPLCAEGSTAMRLFAPDVQRGGDGRYYLFYALEFCGRISVAVSESPVGPFQFYDHVHYPDGTLLGAKEGDAFQYDPGIFVDDNGRVYLVSGFCPIPGINPKFAAMNLVTKGCQLIELADDMCTVREAPQIVLPQQADAEGTEFAEHPFFEAPSLRKANGRYYLIYLELEFEDGIIMNGGAGEFSIAVIGVKQYSKPRIKPTGTLVLNGKTYPISGDAWFDRQWQKVPTQKSKTGEGSDDPVTGGTIHWYWMDLNMDNGDKLSLWCVEIAKITRAWATVLHADGTNKVVDVTPFTQFKAKKWYSQASGQNYPIEFTVEIKDLDAKLYVAPYPVEQEIVSEHISKYEAASQVKGTYLGKPATGFCYVELVGGFK